jgi:ribonuclease PH
VAALIRSTGRHRVVWVQVDIFVHILAAEGGVLAACINAAMLALAHAGLHISLHSMWICRSCFGNYDPSSTALTWCSAAPSASSVVTGCSAATGVPLRDMVAACTVGYLESKALLDLSQLEEAGDGATLTLAAHINLGAIPLLQLDDKLPMEALEKASCVCKLLN